MSATLNGAYGDGIPTHLTGCDSTISVRGVYRFPDTECVIVRMDGWRNGDPSINTWMVPGTHCDAPETRFNRRKGDIS